MHNRMPSLMLLPAALLAALAIPSQANSELDFSHQYRYEGTGEVEHPNDTPSPKQVESYNSVSGDIYSDKRTITVGNLNNNSGKAYSNVQNQAQVRRYSNEQLKNDAQQHRIPAYEDLSRASRSIHGESYGPNHYQWSTSTNDSSAWDDYYNQNQTKPAPPPSEYGQNARPSHGPNGGHFRPGYRPNFDENNPDYMPYPPTQDAYYPHRPPHRPPVSRPQPVMGTAVRACISHERYDGSFSRDHPEHVMITDGHGIMARFNFMPEGNLDNLFLLLNDHGRTRILPMKNRRSLSKAPIILEDITGDHRYRISSSWRRCGG